MSGIRNVANQAEVLAAIETNRVLLAVIQAVTADTNADLVIVDGIVDAIRAVTDALPVLTAAVGNVTTTVINTEYDLYVNNAPLGVYKPILLTVNFLNQQAGETVIIRRYRRDTDGGVWSLLDTSDPYAGVQVPVMVKIDLEAVRFGIRNTIERTGGIARAYPWAAFYEI